MYAEVLIEYNAKTIDKSFTYLIPEKLKNELKVGMKVVVPFSNKLINGFVTNIVTTFNSDYELKEISSIKEKEFVLNKELFALAEYLKKETLCTKIQAIQSMLPSSLKVKEQKTNYEKLVSYIEINVKEDEISNYITNNEKRTKQVEILKRVLEEKKVLKKEISGNSLNTLLEKNILKEVKEQEYRLNNREAKEEDFDLTEEQQRVVNAIDLNKNETYLIHGVTGSGKTEVYIKLIKEVIKKGKTAILLVPEITLTAQIVERFYKRFGSDVAIFHSALSEGEKYDEYLKILRKEVKIVVGTRSAIFTPLENLGIIIIDEEHTESYKQDTNPRYHARDLAKFRAEYNNIPLVLGSATPTLESMARALKGVYKYLELPNRVGASRMPDTIIVDMTEEIKKRNLIFSSLLKDKIKERLERKEQTILLLNRRGFSTIITCSNCGYTYKCPYCDITMTYHKSTNNLRCHYCGYTVLKSEKCPECHESTLNYYGLGTEKLEQELTNLFPLARIVRMDTDTTSKKGSHSRIINAFLDHKYDILLGTQMISKGLDFPKVTLVGVINADTTLNIPDFRSGEKTFALLSQTAGRAGRKDLKGEVILQTFNKDNYILNCVKENNYKKFYQYEMSNRHKLKYPPYYYLCSIKISSRDYEIAGKEANKVRKYLDSHLSCNTIVLGPTTASMFKVNNIYNFQIIIKYKKDDKLFNTLKELDNIFAINNKANISIDTSPMRI